MTNKIYNNFVGAPGMPPGMGMASGGRPQWQPNTSTPMNYSSSSPGNYGVSTKISFKKEIKL